MHNREASDGVIRRYKTFHKNASVLRWAFCSIKYESRIIHFPLSCQFYPGWLSYRTWYDWPYHNTDTKGNWRLCKSGKDVILCCKIKAASQLTLKRPRSANLIDAQTNLDFLMLNSFDILKSKWCVKPSKVEWANLFELLAIARLSFASRTCKDLLPYRSMYSILWRQC